jgi:hypothetical protein
MNNEKLKTIAGKVLNKAGVSQDEEFGSVIAILMMISIILTVVRVLQECNKSKLTAQSTAQDKYAIYGEQLHTLSQRRGWLTKMRIKKLLRRELSSQQYQQYSFQLLNALLDIGANLTDDEVQTLVEAANV